MHIEAASGLVLVIAAAVALIWANSAFADSYESLWHTPIRLGRHDDAVASARKAAELTDYPPPRRAALGCTLSAAGQREESEAIYESLIECRNTKYVSALDLALLATYMKRHEDAFDWLDTAVEERAVWLNHLNADPLWDPIREEPRFKNIVKRIGLT